jgi:hypothetical protein
MSRVAGWVLILLTATLSVMNAQCLVSCSLVPCTAPKKASCHQEQPPASHQHSQSCQHEMLRLSQSEAAQAPLQAPAPAWIAAPLPFFSFVFSSVQSPSPVEPSPPPHGVTASITILRI